MLKNRVQQFILILLCGSIPATAIGDDSSFRLRAHQLDLSNDTEADVDAEIRFGKSISARILGQFRLNENNALNRYVSLVGKALAMNSSRDDIEFHFSVLNENFINAYSAPGGYVFITKGAILAMRDEAELAAVLAHEIAHITEKHIVREFKIRGQDKGAAAGVSRLIGSSKNSAQVLFSQAVDNAVNKLLDKGFKQTDELGSDRVALLLLANTGYDPMALARYLKRIKTLTAIIKKNGAHKPTHPPTNKRIMALQTLAVEENLNRLNFPKMKTRFDQYVKK